MQKSKLSSFSFIYSKRTRSDVYPTIADYDCVLDKIASIGTVSYFTFEKDSKNKFHIHGIALLPKTVRYTSLAIKGYASKYREIFDMKGWINYLEKDQSDKGRFIKGNQGIMDYDPSLDHLDPLQDVDWKKSLFAQSIEQRKPQHNTVASEGQETVASDSE